MSLIKQETHTIDHTRYEYVHFGIGPNLASWRDLWIGVVKLTIDGKYIRMIFVVHPNIVRIALAIIGLALMNF